MSKSVLGIALLACAGLAAQTAAVQKKKNTGLTKPTHSTAAQAASAKGTHSSKTARKTAASRPYVAPQPTPERYQQIQQALLERGYYSGEPNGRWGADSVNALKRFQNDQNLTSDGRLNSLSLIALGLGPKRLSAQAVPAQTKAQPGTATPATSEPGARQ